MVKQATSKINRVGPRHTIYLQKDLVEDTSFPFELNEPLTIRVEGEMLVIGRAGGRAQVSTDFAGEDVEGPAIVNTLDSLGYSPVLSRAEKIYEMLKEVHEAETMERRIRLMPPREHAVLFYRGRDFLDRIISAFFDTAASDSVPKGLLSENRVQLESVKNLLYSDVLGPGKTEFPNRITKWMSELRVSNRSSAATRVAIEDMSWFLENGLHAEVQKLEQQIEEVMRSNSTVLCCYQVAALDTAHVREIVSFHNYIILDTPFRVYRRSRG